jgi:hypothetical protein
MLTKAEALSDVTNGLVIPDKLIKSAHGHYVGLATDMLRIYREGIVWRVRLLRGTGDGLFRGRMAGKITLFGGVEQIVSGSIRRVGRFRLRKSLYGVDFGSRVSGRRFPRVDRHPPGSAREWTPEVVSAAVVAGSSGRG